MTGEGQNTRAVAAIKNDLTLPICGDMVRANILVVRTTEVFNKRG